MHVCTWVSQLERELTYRYVKQRPAKAPEFVDVEAGVDDDNDEQSDPAAVSDDEDPIEVHMHAHQACSSTSHSISFVLSWMFHHAHDSVSQTSGIRICSAIAKGHSPPLVICSACMARLRSMSH